MWPAGAEQLQQQRTLEEEAGRHALLEGSPQHDEAELQAATVKSPKEGPPAQPAPDHPPAKGTEEERVDQMVRDGQEAGAAQLRQQRRAEETGGTRALLGTPAAGKALPASKDGEDGRSAALSGNVAEPGGAKSGLTLARAVQLAAAADKDEAEGENIDDLFDEDDLADAALDDDGNEDAGERTRRRLGLVRCSRQAAPGSASDAPGNCHVCNRGDEPAPDCSNESFRAEGQGEAMGRLLIQFLESLRAHRAACLRLAGEWDEEGGEGDDEDGEWEEDEEDGAAEVEISDYVPGEDSGEGPTGQL